MTLEAAPGEEQVAIGLDAFFGGLDGFRDVFTFIFAKMREMDDRLETVSAAAAMSGPPVSMSEEGTEPLAKHLRGVFERVRSLERWQGATQNDLGKLASAINSLSTTVSQSLAQGGGRPSTPGGFGGVGAAAAAAAAGPAGPAGPRHGKDGRSSQPHSAQQSPAMSHLPERDVHTPPAMTLTSAATHAAKVSPLVTPRKASTISTAPASPRFAVQGPPAMGGTPASAPASLHQMPAPAAPGSLTQLAATGEGAGGLEGRVAALEGQLASLNAQLAQDVASLWDGKADTVEVREIAGRLAAQQGEMRTRVNAAESSLRRAIDDAVMQTTRSIEASLTRNFESRFADKAETLRMIADLSEVKADRTDLASLDVRLESQMTFIGDQVEKLTGRLNMNDEVIKFIRRELADNAESLKQAKEITGRVSRLEEELRAQLKATWQRLAVVAGDGGDPEEIGKREGEKSVKSSEIMSMVEQAMGAVKLLRVAHLELGDRSAKTDESLTKALERIQALERSPARIAAGAAASGDFGAAIQSVAETLMDRIEEGKKFSEERIAQLQIMLQELEERHAGEVQSSAKAMAEVQKQLRASGVALAEVSRMKASARDVELHYALKTEVADAVAFAVGEARGELGSRIEALRGLVAASNNAAHTDTAMRLKCLTCNTSVAPSNPAGARAEPAKGRGQRPAAEPSRAVVQAPPAVPSGGPPNAFAPPKTAPPTSGGYGGLAGHPRPSPGPSDVGSPPAHSHAHAPAPPPTAPSHSLSPPPGPPPHALSPIPAAPSPSAYFNNQGSIPTYTTIREPQVLRASASAPALPPVGDKYVVKVAGYRWSREKNVAPVPLMPAPLVSPPSGNAARNKRMTSEDLIRTYFPRESEELLGRRPAPAAAQAALAAQWELLQRQQAAIAQQMQSAAAQRALAGAAAAAAAAAGGGGVAPPAGPPHVATSTVPRTGPLALAAEPPRPAATRQPAPAAGPVDRRRSTGAATPPAELAAPPPAAPPVALSPWLDDARRGD